MDILPALCCTPLLASQHRVCMCLQLVDGRNRLLDVHTSNLKALRATNHDAAQAQPRTDPDSTQQIRFFTLFLQKYLFSAIHKTFVPMPAMPAHLPGQIRRALGVLRSIDQGKSQSLCQSLPVSLLYTSLAFPKLWMSPIVLVNCCCCCCSRA